MNSENISDHDEGNGQPHCDVLFNDQDQGYGEGPRQQVLENGCVRNYNSRNASKVHGEHLGQRWVCGKYKKSIYMFTFPYLGMRLVRVS